MIRINLLPVRTTKKRNTAILQLIGMGAALAAVLLVTIGVNFYYSNLASNQQAQVAENEAEMKRLRAIIGEVNELEDQKKRLTSQLNVIATLERSKRGPVRVLDEMSSDIPKRVWIREFDEQNSTVTLKGVGLENADISEFMRALEKSKYFDDVNLKESKAKVEDGVPTYHFTLTCKVNYAA